MTEKTERILAIAALGGAIVGMASVLYSASVAASAIQSARMQRAHHVTEYSLAVATVCVVYLIWRLVAFVRRARVDSD
ncbi:MAG TPA: hypothetical protein VGL42_01475 [Opitutaceae bacterium]|jgi:hypothetical protein